MTSRLVIITDAAGLAPVWTAGALGAAAFDASGCCVALGGAACCVVFGAEGCWPVAFCGSAAPAREASKAIKKAFLTAPPQLLAAKQSSIRVFDLVRVPGEVSNTGNRMSIAHDRADRVLPPVDGLCFLGFHRYNSPLRGSISRSAKKLHLLSSESSSTVAQSAKTCRGRHLVPKAVSTKRTFHVLTTLILSYPR